MKYLCRRKDEHDHFGIGDSIEEALSDYLNETSDCLDFKNLEWFELKDISVKVTVAPKTTTTAKAKK